MGLKDRLLGMAASIISPVVAAYDIVKSVVNPKAVKVKPVKAASQGGGVVGYKSSTVSSSPQAIRLGRKIAQDPAIIFDKCKEVLIEELRKHPVTQEIQAGPTGKSAFLSSGGDLFSFIGFPAGSKPISDLEDFLDNHINFEGYKGLKTGGGLIIFEFKISIPDESDFASRENLCLFWEKTNPWPFAVEKGIAGYSNYLPFKDDMAKSVSKRGLQMKNEIREGEFSPTPYITQILNNFKKNLNNFGLAARFN